jgi:hypothetical protein
VTCFSSLRVYFTHYFSVGSNREAFEELWADRLEDGEKLMERVSRKEMWLRKAGFPTQQKAAGRTLSGLIRSEQRLPYSPESDLPYPDLPYEDKFEGRLYNMEDSTSQRLGPAIKNYYQTVTGNE